MLLSVLFGEKKFRFFTAFIVLAFFLFFACLNVYCVSWLTSVPNNVVLVCMGKMLCAAPVVWFGSTKLCRTFTLSRGFGLKPESCYAFFIYSLVVCPYTFAKQHGVLWTLHHYHVHIYCIVHGEIFVNLSCVCRHTLL